MLIQCPNEKHEPFERTCFNVENRGCICLQCKFENNLKDKYPDDEFVPKGKYMRDDEHVDVLHKKCNRIWSTTPRNILKGHGCALCSRDNAHKANLKEHDDFINEISDKLVGYEVLDKYVNGLTDMHVLHLECSRITPIKPSIVRKEERKSLCKWCRREYTSKLRTKSHEDYVSELESNFPKQFEVLSEYINAKREVMVKHLECGNIYPINASHLLNHGSCATCNTSSGEKAINKVLVNNSISFERQKKYDGLIGVGKGKLSYDFYIHNNQKDVLIEFNGIQHYEFSEFFHETIDDFHKQLKHDKLKETYASKNGIKLITIPYWDFEKIEDILKRELNIA